MSTVMDASAIAALTSAVASASLTGACSVYFEEFEATYGLSIRDLCPDCDPPRLGTRHARRPASVAVSSSPDAVPSSRPSSNLISPETTAFIKLKAHLPIWTKQSVCRTFIQHLERVLTTAGIPNQYWTSVFGFVVEDYAAAEWVKANITDAKLDWPAAVKAFTQHFQVSDYSTQLSNDYWEIKQTKDETVQQFSDRFTNYCTQLDIPDDDLRAIEHFLRRIRPEMSRKFYDYRANKQADDSSFAVTSLSKVIAICIHFDVACRTAMLQHGTTEKVDGRSASSSKSNGPSVGVHAKMYCSYHQVNTHNTADCKARKHDASSTTASSSSSSAYTAKTASDRKANVTCHACGNRGHYANDASCPKKSQPGISLSATSVTKTEAVSTSAASGLGAAATRITQSGRVSAPPERYTPSVRTVSTDDELRVNTVGLESQSSSTSSTVPPATARRTVWFMINGVFYTTLLDTGADVSCIDEQLAKKLAVPVVPKDGAIKLAHVGLKAGRIGTTSPISLTAVFSMDTPTLGSKAVTHPFEVMALDTKEYQFILGRDLMGRLFPDNIPSAFYLQAPASTAAASLEPSLCRATVIETLIDDVKTGHIDPARLINELAGLGETPVEEVSERYAVSTSLDLEKEYLAKREAVMADPRIVKALSDNEAITGFCSLPESELRLEVDPQLEPTLYRKQYQVPQTARPAVSECVQRWHEAGRIELAPPNCRYNSAICVALKKDAFGNFTGFRICLDMRPLNKALTVTDRFQLPYIRHVLERFSAAASSVSSTCRRPTCSSHCIRTLVRTRRSPGTAASTCSSAARSASTCCRRTSSVPCRSLFPDLPFTCPYLDNLPFGSANWDEHREQALRSSRGCNSANLKIKPSSVKIGHAEIRCLGHLLTGNGVCALSKQGRTNHGLDAATHRQGAADVPRLRHVHPPSHPSLRRLDRRRSRRSRTRAVTSSGRTAA